MTLNWLLSILLFEKKKKPNALKCGLGLQHLSDNVKCKQQQYEGRHPFSNRVECWAGPKFDAGSAEKVVFLDLSISRLHLIFSWTTACVHPDAPEQKESLAEDKE